MPAPVPMPKTKVGMIAAMADAMKAMKKAELEASYGKMTAMYAFTMTWTKWSMATRRKRKL